MNIQQYIDNLNNRYALGNATEHTFRGDLQQLIESLVPEIRATNEPKRIKCGAPDYVLTRKEIPVGYIEAKDIGVDLQHKSLKEQFDRYKNALANLIFTDYLSFHFYRNGTEYLNLKIGEVSNGKIIALTANFLEFEMAIRNFVSTVTQSIKSPTQLAELMAEKAKFMAVQIQKAVESDVETAENSQLQQQYKAFQETLVPDLTAKGFADMYAQTIAYGMFAARYHDPTLETFSRQEAATLIPLSNPFLRKLFQNIAGYDLDTRINYLVDDLVQIFLATDVKEIMQNFGKGTQQDDAVIHFYETFLAKYDPALRKARGVWYTPQAVVNFIVRAVDEVLKTEFGLAKGLADSSKIKVKAEENGKKTEKEFHKVQILDPAVGTGTFLAEVVNHIYKKFAGQQGIWKQYVEKELIPRLNGFELLMTSYAMAHLKMDILLSEKGFTNEKNQRFRIFLTNSLEEASANEHNLFSQWLSQEASEANRIKRNTPVMVVLGNPPYSVSSHNKSAWIQNLVADYKKNLNEQNIQPLSDDYIKFIRFGQHFIDKNGSGVLAYISNNSFLDGIIHRQMRKHLLESFDSIYILDLHGNAKKKETALDGSTDQNVFDIMQGVSINIFVKTAKKQKEGLAKVFHFDLQGKREMKYDFLKENSLKSVQWNLLEYSEPNYFFVKKDFAEIKNYEKGFKIDELFNNNNAGLATEFDEFVINMKEDKINHILSDLNNLSSLQIISKHKLDIKKTEKIERAIKDVKNNTPSIKTIDYRPFDVRYTIYTGISNGIMGRPRHSIMKQMLHNNISLLVCKQQTSFNFQHIFISNKISERCMVSLQTGEVNYVFPLYLYIPKKEGEIQLNDNNDTSLRNPNLNKEIVEKIAEYIGLSFTPEKEAKEGTFAPIDILDYIYAVLHSPTYREQYKEFLKIDFPRVPYPQNKDIFWAYVRLGGELRALHLLESEKVEEYITQYPQEGDNVVGKVRFDAGKVYINDTQYFENVPEVAWSFYIGGYQPAQKWLKDRKGRELDFEEILHYQQMIVALSETARIMQEIDKVVSL